MFSIKLVRSIDLLDGTLESPQEHSHKSRGTLISPQQRKNSSVYLESTRDEALIHMHWLQSHTASHIKHDN